MAFRIIIGSELKNESHLCPCINKKYREGNNSYKPVTYRVNVAEHAEKKYDESSEVFETEVLAEGTL